MNYISLVSALCALTSLSTAMNHQTGRPQVAHISEALSGCVEFKDLMFELGAILYKGKLDKKGLLHLASCFHKDKIAQLFACPPDTFERLIDTKYLSKYCTLIVEKSSDADASSKKARALRKSFPIDAWEEKLECKNLDPVLTDLTKLIYFTGTPLEKKELLKKLKRAVSQLLPEGDAEPRKIDAYFDLKPLIKIIEDLLADKEISEEALVSVIKTDQLLENIPENPASLSNYVHLKNLLIFIVTLIRADLTQKDPSLPALLSCIRWDSFFISLPEFLGKSPHALTTFFSRDALKRQITLLQEGTELTAEGLRTILNREALEMVITPDSVEKLINFENLAKGLNALRRGEQAQELQDIFNFPALESVLGKELLEAFKTDLPESVHNKKFSEFIEHCTKPKYLGIIASAMTLFWLAGHTVCHACMEAFEPQGMTAALLLTGAVGAVYGGTQFIEHKKPLSTALYNTVAVKIHRALANLLPHASPSKAELLKYPPADERLKEMYITFVNLLKDNQLAMLTKPIELTKLFDRPRTFVTMQSRFIEGLCSDENEHAKEHLKIMRKLLERVTPFEELKHKESIETFFDYLTPDTIRLLPHKDFIKVARYCPHMLHKQTAFLQRASTFILGTKPIISYFYEALKQAEELHEIDLAH
jgi:hypothetical protein